MPFALFSDNVQVSRAFPTKSDVWRHAEDSGLIIEVGSSDEDPPRRVLDMACAIRACEPDISTEETTSFHEVPVRMVDVGRKMEAAAS